MSMFTHKVVTAPHLQANAPEQESDGILDDFTSLFGLEAILASR